MKRIIFIIVVQLVIVSVGYLIFRMNKDIPDLDPVIIKKEIYSDNLDESIYMKEISRGLNYKIVVITSSNEERAEPKPDEEYVYSWVPIFYKMENDTLFVYSYKQAMEPLNFNSNIIVKQVELNNLEMMDLFGKHKEKGIMKIQ